MAEVKLEALCAAATLLLPALCLIGCQNRQREIGTQPDVVVPLSSFGLPPAFFRKEVTDECASHIIGYRFVVWMPDDHVAVGFNTSPNCRLTFGNRFDGNARILIFDLHGKLTAKRDLRYDADGGDEIVAPGEAMAGPNGTLLFRIEEAGQSKSGVLLLNNSLQDVARIDRFMESPAPVGDHAIAFQEGFVLDGPRTYDIVGADRSSQSSRVTEGMPMGAMDRKLGAQGTAFVNCSQELAPGIYQQSKIVYAGAHRRCTVNWLSKDGRTWSSSLEQDQVVEIGGFGADGSIVGVVRSPKDPERLAVWRKDQPVEDISWFPDGYDTKLESASIDLRLFLGYGTKRDGFLCQVAGLACDVRSGRLIIANRFDHALITDRALDRNARAALAPDGLHYATFESGELRIYSLPGPK